MTIGKIQLSLAEHAATSHAHPKTFQTITIELILVKQPNSPWEPRGTRSAALPGES